MTIFFTLADKICFACATGSPARRMCTLLAESGTLAPAKRTPPTVARGVSAQPNDVRWTAWSRRAASRTPRRRADGGGYGAWRWRGHEGAARWRRCDDGERAVGERERWRERGEGGCSEGAGGEGAGEGDDARGLHVGDRAMPMVVETASAARPRGRWRSRR